MSDADSRDASHARSSTDPSRKGRPRNRHRKSPSNAEFDPQRPFTRAQAIAAGIDANALRGRGFRSLFRDVYVDATAPITPRLRAEASLVLCHPSAWASHASAARIHGVPIPTLPDEHISVCEAAHRLNRAGIRSHVAPKDSQIFVLDAGVRVSAYEQMFVELGTLLGLVDLVVVGDHLVRKGKTTLRKLRAFCEASTLPGAAAARRAAGYVRERVDSPMETRLRLLIVLAGLPEPQVNLTIADQDGLPLRRYDLSYPSVKVVVEYDGRHHVEREEQWESDLDRREEIDDDGWRILVVVASGIYKEPERTLLRVQGLLMKRRLPGVPRRLKDDWRPHFPGRE